MWPHCKSMFIQKLSLNNINHPKSAHRLEDAHLREIEEDIEVIHSYLKLSGHHENE